MHANVVCLWKIMPRLITWGMTANAIHSDSKKRRAFAASLFTAGYDERYMSR